jgi:hypothetical protein
MAVGTSLRGIIVHRAFGLDIPQTLEDVCDPTRLALIVYDMQVGIVNQIKNGPEITNKVLQVLEAARGAGIRVFFTRHMSLPKELMGVSQLRTAMAWQRVTSVSEVKPWFLRDAPGFHLIPEMTPLPSEAVFDKIMMSAFEGTPLDIPLRDCGIDASPSWASPWKSALNRRCDMALILATFQCWSWTPVAPAIRCGSPFASQPYLRRRRIAYGRRGHQCSIPAHTVQRTARH